METEEMTISSVLGCWLLFSRSGSLNFVLRERRCSQHFLEQGIELALVYLDFIGHK